MIRKKERCDTVRELWVFGVRIDNVAKGEAVERVMEYVEGRDGERCVVFTPNVTMLDACRRDEGLRRLMNRATVSLPDGAGVVRAARRAKKPLKERVAGIEFGEALLERAAMRGVRVFLLGGGDGVARRAGERLTERYAGLCVCGTEDGYFNRDGEENRRVLERIRESGAEILYVCMGFPTQEEWIVQNSEALGGVRVVAALGGSLDVWSGRIRRAPQIFSRLGLEWAWRMAREPRRLKHLPAIVRSIFLGRGSAF